MQIRGPHPLAPGVRIDYGADESITVLDLDYEARPDEFTPPLRRSLTFSCEQLVCRVQLDVSSRTGSGELDRAFAELLAGGPGTSEDDAIHCSDPVELVLGVRALYAQLHAPLVGHELQARTRDAWIGASALELLREDTAPARAAWTWLGRYGRLPQLHAGELLGAAIDVSRAATLTEELVREAGKAPGLVVWVTGLGCAWLMRVERTTVLGPTGDIELGDHRQLARTTLHNLDGDWFADVVPEAWSRAPALSRMPLRVGTKLDLESVSVEIVAIR